MPTKKHETPKHLDYLFTRQVIPTSRYQEYWEGYWKTTGSARRSFTDQYVSDLQTHIPKLKRKAGTITSKRAAQQQADNMGGYIARVTKTGRRSKKGKFWRAFPKRKQKLS